MKKAICFFILCFSCCQAFTQNAVLNWAKGFDITLPSSSISPTRLAADNTGNCVLIGDYMGTCDFAIDSAQFMMTALSTKDAFIAKYSASGQLLWVNGYEQPATTSFAIYRVKCDLNDNIIVIGVIKDTIDVNPNGTPYLLSPSDSNGNGFVMKLDPNGALLWAKTSMCTPAQMSFFELSVSPAGDIIIPGFFTDTIDFDFGPGIANDTIYAGTGSDGFLLKMDANGNYVWHKCFKGAGSVQVKDITYDSGGNLYAAGSFSQMNDFDPGPGTLYVSAFGSADGMVIVMDAAGNLIRMFKPGVDNYYDGVMMITIDENDFLYIHGAWDMVIDFDPGPGVSSLTATGDEGYYLAKTDIYGNVLWAVTSGTYIDGFDNVIANSMSYDPVNGILLGGHFSIDYDFDPSSNGTFNVVHNNQDAFLVNFDVNGNFNGAAIYSGQGGDNINYLSTTEQGTIFLTGYFAYAVDFDPGPGQYILNSVPAGGYSNEYLSCLNQHANYATGNVYRDMNLNGVNDVGDFPLAGNIVHVNGGSSFITSPNGNYIAQFDTGTINVTYPAIPASATVIPSVHVISNATYNNTSTGKDFAVQVNAGITNGSIVMTNVNPTRTGRFSYIDIKYANNGSVPVSGSVKLVADPLLTNITADVPPFNVSADTIWWNFSNLAPMDTATIRLTALVSISAVIGTVIHNYTDLILSTGDVFPADNTDTLNQVVTGSFDPNDKQVIPETGFTTQQAANGEYLEYIIRFQNTGNDTAFIVQVVDTLSPLLDVSTFEQMASSHQHITQLSGGHILRFIFNNILLPDSTTNEAESHGYIRYRIKPLNTINVGDHIENTAHIYFDFNAPVATNTVLTAITSTSGIYIGKAGSVSLIAYPNPVSNGGTMILKCSLAEMVNINIYNIHGEVVYAEMNANCSAGHILPVQRLSPGVYNCIVAGSTGSAAFKIAVIDSE